VSLSPEQSSRSGASASGSHYLVYIRDDERTTPPGVNAYEVRVIRRGVIEVRDDLFVSPCNPVIEDRPRPGAVSSERDPPAGGVCN
jgi:Immunity protein 7